MAMWTHHGRGEEPASESGRYKGKRPQGSAGFALRYRFCDTAEVGVVDKNERGRDSDRSETMFALTTLLFCGSGLRGGWEDSA